jgi:chromosome segregation ATPase
VIRGKRLTPEQFAAKWLDILLLGNLRRKLQRARISQTQLLRQVDTLTKESERLRQRLAAVQAAKDQAEKHAEDRRREKEALRARLRSQDKTLELHDTVVAQLGAKITELTAEIDRLKRSKKK